MTSVKGYSTKAILQSRKWINGTLVESPNSAKILAFRCLVNNECFINLN